MDSNKSAGVQGVQDQSLSVQLCPTSSSAGYTLTTGIQQQPHQIHYQQMPSGASNQTPTIHLQLPSSTSSQFMLQQSTSLPLMQLTNGQAIPVSGQNAVSFVVPPTAALVQGQGTGAFFIPFPGQQGNTISVQQQVVQQQQQLQQFQPEQQLQQQRQTPVATPAPTTSRSRKKNTPSTGGGLNAYAVFTKDIRQRLVEQHPDATFSDLAKITGVEWRSLTEQQKAVYREKARHMQEEAQASLHRQKQQQQAQQSQIQVASGGHTTLFEGSSSFDPSSIDFSSFLSSPAFVTTSRPNDVAQHHQTQLIKSEGQVMSNMNNPTSPSLIKPGARNGFILFSKELRPKLKQDYPNASFGELSKLTGVEWKKLNDTQKREWEERAFKLAEEKQQSRPMQMQAGPSHQEVQVQPISSDAKVLDILGQAAQLLGLAGPLTQHHHPQHQTQHIQQHQHIKNNPVPVQIQIQDPKQEWTSAQQQYHQSTQPQTNEQTETVPVWSQEPHPQPPQKKPAKKRPPRKRNPPTGTGSGYVLFAKEVRNRVKAEHPEASFGEIGKYTGGEWAKITHEEKVEWGIKMDELLESKGKRPRGNRPPAVVHPPEPKPSSPSAMEQRMFNM